MPPSEPLDPRREPAADVRTAARQLREIYVALVREGFTVNEAIKIIGEVLASQTRGKG